MLVDAVRAIVVGRIRLDDDHQVVVTHPGAQRRFDAVERASHDVLEFLGRNVVRH